MEAEYYLLLIGSIIIMFKLKERALRAKAPSYAYLSHIIFTVGWLLI